MIACLNHKWIYATTKNKKTFPAEAILIQHCLESFPRPPPTSPPPYFWPGTALFTRLLMFPSSLHRRIPGRPSAARAGPRTPSAPVGTVRAACRARPPLRARARTRAGSGTTTGSRWSRRTGARAGSSTPDLQQQQREIYSLLYYRYWCRKQHTRPATTTTRDLQFVIL